MLIGSWVLVRGNSYVFQNMEVPFNILYNIFKDTSIAPSIAKDIDGFYFTDSLTKNHFMFTDDGQIFLNVGLEVSNAPRLNNAPRTNELSSSNPFSSIDLPRYQRSDLPPSPYQIVFASKGAYTVSGSRLTYVFEDLVVKIEPEDLWSESTTAEIKRAYRGMSDIVASANVILLGNTLTLTHEVGGSKTILSRKS